MELSSELKKTLVENSNHKSVKVFYNNGKIIEGFVGKIHIGSFFSVGLTQLKCLRNEDPTVDLDFEEISKIEISYKGGDIITYT